MLANAHQTDNSSLFEDISHRFAVARKAQKEWANVPFKQRKSYLDTMQKYIVQHADELVEIICQDTGKTKVDALADEIIPCAFACQWYGNNAERVLADKSLATSIPILFNKQSMVSRLPLGVVAIISPWNYPFSIPFGEVVMGLMAGNAILLKTSQEVTPQIGPMIRRIVEASGLPDGLFHLIEGPGPDVADAFFANKVDKIFFTGSVRVGKELLSKSANTLTPLSLELGGNDPMIVLEDADLERATNGAAWGGYQNAGQTCAGIERVYVHEKIYEPFIQLLTAKTKALRHGHFSQPDVEIGAVTTAKQLLTIREHVEDAIQRGARILAQSTGVQAEGSYFPATLMVDVDHSMRIMREETFGPVLCVMKVRDEEEALSLANDSHYALTSSVWTKDGARGQRLAKRIEAGVTTINDHCITHAFSETPWGGWKDSGLGRTHGAAGLEEMTHCKVINWDILPAKRNIFWYPFSQETYDGLRDALICSFPQKPTQFLHHGLRLIPFALKTMFTAWSSKAPKSKD